MPPIFTTPGAEASHRWLLALGLRPVPQWHAEVAVLADGDSRLDLNVYMEEWGFSFHHDGRMSWIRVTDIPFVHGRDDFRLLPRNPDLLGIHVLLAELEVDHGIEFRRATASVRSNVAGAAEVVRDWLLQPLPASTVKKTVELCADLMHEGVRCSLLKGHDGDHVHEPPEGGGQLRWK